MALLPYLEQAPLYNGITDYTTRNTAITVRLTCYRCPSDNSMDSGATFTQEMSSYACNPKVFADNSTAAGYARYSLLTVPDGLSNTLGFTERYMRVLEQLSTPSNSSCHWGIVDPAAALTGCGQSGPIFYWQAGRGPQIGVPPSQVTSGGCGPTSPHPDTIQVALLDGGVRGMRGGPAWDPTVLPDDGLAIPAD